MRLVAQAEPSAEARPELFWAPKELSVSRPISLVPPMLSLFHPMPYRARPIPFSVERVVAQRLNLVFGTSKSTLKESAPTEQKFFYMTGQLDLL